MKLFGSNINKFLISSQKKAFLIFQEKIPYVSGKLSYISGNPKKLLTFPEIELSSLTELNKKF